MRGLRTSRANLSLSRSFSRIFVPRISKRREREMRRWVKKGSGIEKETMSSARRRILESIHPSLFPWLIIHFRLVGRIVAFRLWTRDINSHFVLWIIILYIYTTPIEFSPLSNHWHTREMLMMKRTEEYFCNIRFAKKSDPFSIEFKNTISIEENKFRLFLDYSNIALEVLIMDFE